MFFLFSMLSLPYGFFFFACQSSTEKENNASTKDEDIVDDGEEEAACSAGVFPRIDLSVKAGIRQTTSSYNLPWDGSEREVDLHIWYPTEDTDGEAASYLGFVFDSDSLVDATHLALEEGCQHPLVVYSHGSQAWAGGGSPLLRQFVQAGWVAIGPDHTGNTLTENWDPRPTIFDLLRREDIQHAIDYLENLAEDDPLFARVNTERVLVIGHSYGARTSWMLSGPELNMDVIAVDCEDDCSAEELEAYGEYDFDTRVVASMPLAGRIDEDRIAEDGFAAIQAPVLMMTGSEDFDGRPYFDRAAQTPSLRWVDIEGACHESFTATELPCAGMEKEESLRIVATYGLAMGIKYVEQEESTEVEEILSGQAEVSGSASFLSNE